MAFTEAEIEKALTSIENGPVNHAVDFEKLSQSVNYQPIIDYLTGKTNSLSLQMDYNSAHGWIRLQNLLKNIEKPSANDHLVLNVIKHPDLFQFLGYFFNIWLFNYVLAHDEKGALQAVINQFRAQGMSDDDIFMYFMVSLGFLDDNQESNIDHKVLKEYLSEYIRKSKQLIQPKSRHIYHSYEWSLNYFKLLEEVRPDQATEYVLQGVNLESNRNPVVFFSEYRKGYYMPAILASIRDSRAIGLSSLGVKLKGALLLYDAFREKYEDIAAEMSLRYLETMKALIMHQYWPGSFYFTEFRNTDISSITYSACAFHVLLRKDRDKALAILEDFFAQKKHIYFDTIKVLHFHLGNNAFPYVERIMQADSIKIDEYRQMIGFLEMKFDSSEYLPLIWELAGNKSRPLRELVARIVVERDADVEPKAIELMESKNSDARQTAALVLAQLTSPVASDAIASALDKETNDNARDILLQAVAHSLPEKADKSFIDHVVNAAKERGKLKKPIEAWLDEASLPSLYDHAGKEINPEFVRFLLYRMSRVKDMRSDIEAKYILQLADKEKAAPFALELIKTYIDKGAKPEFKYLMALAALLGNDAVVDKIRITINKWMDDNRYKMAEYGVGALALQGSDKALRWVEWYSRKYKSKKANVGAAALAALETAAEELGITIQELGDRVVPDFGFEGLFKHFKIEDEEYRAFIDSNFKIAFFNENNKKLKSLPAAAGAELKEEFKAIGKEVRDVVRSQSPRLEYYLIIQRRWGFEQWQKFFLQNPVMFIYATKLLWGVYDKGGKLLQTFLCNEDTSLIDANNDEISIDAAHFIGIVHPSQLDAESLQQWKKQFFDLSIESIFPQLDRKMPDMTDIDLSKGIITKFNGKDTATGSIRSTLERYGWHKGPTGDGGMLDSFNLLYTEGGMEAVLEIEGVGVGYGWGGDEKTGRLYVIDKSKITQRWFSSPQNDSDERLIKLENVPLIFLNEMLAAVELIKAKDKQ